MLKRMYEHIKSERDASVQLGQYLTAEDEILRNQVKQLNTRIFVLEVALSEEKSVNVRTMSNNDILVNKLKESF